MPDSLKVMPLVMVRRFSTVTVGRKILVKVFKFFWENIINIFVQGKLALFYKKSDSHSCDAFAPGMGDMPDSAAIRREVGFADDFPVSKNHEMMHVCIVGSHQITEQIRQHIGRNALAFRCCSGKWLLIGLVKWELGLLREKIYSACAIGFSKNVLVISSATAICSFAIGCSFLVKGILGNCYISITKS